MYQKSIYFKKIFTSFILMVLIPITVLCIALCYIGVMKMYIEVQSKQRLLLAQACETLDMRIKEIQDLSLTISMDPQLIGIDQQASVSAQLAEIRKLKSYTINSFIKEILILSGRDNICFSSSGVVEVEVFLHANGFRETDIQQFFQIITSQSKAIYFFPYQQILMCFNPIPIFNREPTGYAVFVIDNSSFEGLFSQKYIKEYGSLAIINEKNEPLYQLDNLNLLDNNALITALMTSEENVQAEYIVNGSKFSMIIEDMERLPWRLVSILPKSWILDKTNIRTVIITIAGTLLLALGLTILFARKQYMPIRKLAIQTGLEVENNKCPDELSMLNTALHTLRERNLYVQKSSMLLRLLQGDSVSRGEALSTLQSLGCLCSSDEWQVMVLCMNIQHYNSAELLCSFVEDNFTYKDEVQIAYFKSADQAFCIFMFVPNVIHDLIQKIEEYIKQQDCVYAMGISPPHPLSEAGTAYNEATLALRVLEYKSLIRVDISNVILSEQRNLDTIILNYCNALRIVDCSAAYAALDEIRKLAEMNKSSRLWNYYVYRFSQAVMQLSKENAQYCHDISFSQLTQQAALLLTISSDSELWGMMNEITRLCLNVFDVTRHKLQNDKVTNIMRWLEENICNPNLSLEMIAQEFGHSSTYWSRHFQELSGQRFSDFIWAKRLTLVKQKLRSTDASIKEVVQSVGYWNVASFARRFRKEEGLTINQWRELENRKSGA